MRPTAFHTWILLVALAVLLPEPAGAGPPVLERLFPAGGRRGERVEVVAEGKFEEWPVKARAQARGIEFQAEKEKGTFSVSVAKDAPAGVTWVRLYNGEGASVAKPFVVGNLPEIVEVEPNDGPSEAQEVKLASVTVNGRLAKNEDVDGYAVALEEGQTLVAALQGNRGMLSPMDGVLQVARGDGLVLAQEDDSGGLDPRLVFEAPEQGTYIVRTFAFPSSPTSAIRFAGGPDYVYRLTLTTGPFADHAEPLAVPRDNPGWVGVVGWNIPDEMRVLPVVPVEGSPERGLAEHPELAAPVEVQVVPRPVALERARAGGEVQEVEAPVSLTGRLASAGERDIYRFQAKKGERLRFRVASRTLGFPPDSVVRVVGADDKVLAESDDAHTWSRDSEVTFEPPADGEYRVEVRDLNGRGGPRFVYRLDVFPPEPDVVLGLSTELFTLTPGKPLEIAVAVNRQDGFDGVLRVSVEGLPEGVSVSPGKSEGQGETAKSATVTLTSESGPAWSGPVRIVGESDSLPSARQAPGYLWLTVLPPGGPEAEASDKDGSKEGKK